MTAPQRFSKTATEAYEAIAEVELTDARQLIDAVVRYYAESGFGDMAAITDEATIADLSAVIQRVAEWESGFQNIKSPSGPWYGYFQNDIVVGRGAGYTEDELLDPITNTIIAVEELLPLAQQGYATDGVEGAAWNAVVLGQRPLGSQTLRGLPPLAGETEENAAAVRRMASHAAGGAEIGSQITAQQTAPTDGGGASGAAGGVKERQDYIDRCVAAGGSLGQCVKEARERFPEEDGEEADLTPSDRWAMRSWNEAHPGQTVTESEIKAAKKIWPDLPAIAAIRNFVEGTAAGEGEEAVKVTDADRQRVWDLGLDLSDAEIKEAKRQGIPFEDYALLKETAERLGVSPAKLAQALTAAGGDPEAVRGILEGLERDAMLADATARVQAGRPGMTEAEARAYAEQGLAAGAAPEEIGYAARNNMPVEALISVKEQLDQVAQSAADPRAVPGLSEAIDGWANNQTPFQLAQQKQFQLEAGPRLRQLEALAARLGKTPEQLYNTARTLGRGDISAGLREIRRITLGLSKEQYGTYEEMMTGRWQRRATELVEKGRAGVPGGTMELSRLTPDEREEYRTKAETLYRVAGPGVYSAVSAALGPMGRAMGGGGAGALTAGGGLDLGVGGGAGGTWRDRGREEQAQARAERSAELARGREQAFLDLGPEERAVLLARNAPEQPLQEMTQAAPPASAGSQELRRPTVLGTEDVFVPAAPTKRPEDEQAEEDNRQLRRARAPAVGGGVMGGGLT